METYALKKKMIWVAQMRMLMSWNGTDDVTNPCPLTRLHREKFLLWHCIIFILSEGIALVSSDCGCMKSGWKERSSLRKNLDWNVSGKKLHRKGKRKKRWLVYLQKQTQMNIHVNTLDRLRDSLLISYELDEDTHQCAFLRSFFLRECSLLFCWLSCIHSWW